MVGKGDRGQSTLIYLDRPHSPFLLDIFWHVKKYRVGSPSFSRSGSDREEVESIGNRSYNESSLVGMISSRSAVPDQLDSYSIHTRYYTMGFQSSRLRFFHSSTSGSGQLLISPTELDHDSTYIRPHSITSRYTSRSHSTIVEHMLLICLRLCLI